MTTDELAPKPEPVLFTRETIAERSKRRVVKYEANGFAFWLRSITERERVAEEWAMGKLQEKGDRQAAYSQLRARMIQQCMCDEHGRRIFSDSTDDTDEIMSLEAQVTNTIFEAIEEMNGAITPTRADVEDAAKN